MKRIEGINYLKQKIASSLLPLIGKSCVLYDVPFYKNIGDILIWQGELDFLQENGITIIDYADYHTYKYKSLSHDVTILFQGGGNIGDLYHEHTELLLKLVKDYPDNRIVVLSQTVYYNDEAIFNKDFNQISSHRDLFFCARDERSYNKLKGKLGDKALVVPDMAFCIDTDKLRKWEVAKRGHSLYVRRNDVESVDAALNKSFSEISDWPCFEKKIMRSNIGNTILDRIYRYIPWTRNILREYWKSYAYETFRVNMIKDGVEFISAYDEITSERLHGCILAILLGKKVNVVDNSYGKNATFYEKWLKDIDDVKMLSL